MEGDIPALNQEQPQASRLKMPIGMDPAASQTELLSWSYVVERLEQAQNYWLATTRPDHRPHVTPVWGVWVASAFFFDGIPTARWARNLAANPGAAVHLESGTEVVVVEGIVEDIPAITDAALADTIIAAWTAKYGRFIPAVVRSGIFRLQPRTARAWTRFPDDATRWQFPAD